MNRKQIARERNIVFRRYARGMIPIMKRTFSLQFDDLISKIRGQQRAPLEVNINDLFNDWERWDAYLKDKVSPQMIAAIRAGFEQSKLAAQISGTFYPNDVYVQNALFESTQKISTINQTTRNKVTAVITEYVSTGKGLDELITKLQTEVLPSHQAARARTIATTTTTTAMNAGSNAMMQRFRDDLQYQQWFSQKDDKVRESLDFDHVEADGQRVEIGQPFIVSGESLRYPGDPSGSLGNIINCRCFAIPIKKK